MTVMYNANEIFRIGVEIEKNGREFYLQAMNLEGDADSKKLFSDLAGWEDTHIALFESHRQNLSKELLEEDNFDQDEEMARYLKAAAATHVFRTGQNIAELLKECKDVLGALKMALRFEKDSVVVYSVMKDLVPPSLGRDAIDKLIREELMHVAFITDKIGQLE